MVQDRFFPFIPEFYLFMVPNIFAYIPYFVSVLKGNLLTQDQGRPHQNKSKCSYFLAQVFKSIY